MEFKLTEKDRTWKHKIVKINNWFNKKTVSFLHIVIINIILLIILLVLIIIGYLNPWSLLILFYGIILLWFFFYSNKVTEELALLSFDKDSSKPIDIRSKLNKLLILLNFAMDFYEISILSYIQLKERRFLIKILKGLIYGLFIITFFLFILGSNLDLGSGYIEIRSLIINILSLFFILHLKLERTKRDSYLFKNWILLAKRQILSITQFYPLKKVCEDISPDIANLNMRIENYSLYFNPVNKIINIGEKLGYFLTIISILIPPILNINILMKFFSYYTTIMVLFFTFLALYFYFLIYDNIKFHRNDIIKSWKSELDNILKNVYINYTQKLQESKKAKN